MAAGIALMVLLAAADDTRPSLAGLPAPVRALIERRWRCNHWAGEEPYDPDRAREIEHALRTGRCDRIDHDEALVRRRYAERPDVLRAIAETRDAD